MRLLFHFELMADQKSSECVEIDLNSTVFYIIESFMASKRLTGNYSLFVIDEKSTRKCLGIESLAVILFDMQTSGKSAIMAPNDSTFTPLRYQVCRALPLESLHKRKLFLHDYTTHTISIGKKRLYTTSPPNNKT